jgi:hypothetical protein
MTFRTLPVLLLTVLTAFGCGPAQNEKPLTPAGLIGSQMVATNGMATNGMATNGMATNGMATNGMATNGMATNGMATNGMATNGMATNGMATNGMATNGMATNGMATNGLAPGEGTSGISVNALSDAGIQTSEFQAWFAASPSYADMVMSYVVKCALPEGTVLSYDHDGATYAWPGVLGVAPAWADGPISATDQELVSACLAAHTNGYGLHVMISVRGYKADGTTIAVTAEEAAGWTFREACFFGNLFDAYGVGVALEPDLLDPKYSTPRGCATEFGVSQQCSPMTQSADLCSTYCSVGPDGKTWQTCTLPDGRTFHPVQVFLQQSDVNVCGDGICSFPENDSSCAADCAPPPTEPPPTDPSAAPADSGTVP